MVIGIIGGGASGMAAALAAAESPQNQVLLLERQQRVGRKLQATGNGRCNLTNLHAMEGGYHGENREFSRYALERFSPAETLKWFEHLGLVTVAEPSGRVYPFSDQANSVVDILRFALDKPNIRLETGVEVQKVKREEEGFRRETTQGVFYCHRLIVACGGLAGTKLGGSMSGYKLLRSLGHRCTRLRPALVQIKTDWPGITALKGVRAQCKAEITCDGAFWSGSVGEIQFTEWGLSGPVMFELSRDVCQEKGSWVCRMDFLPDMDRETLLEELRRRRETRLPATELFTGILHNRLGRVLTQAAGISLTLAPNQAEHLLVLPRQPHGQFIGDPEKYLCDCTVLEQHATRECLTGTLTASPKILFRADAAPRAVLVEGQPVAFAPGDGFYEIAWEGTGRIHIQVLF